MGLREYPTDKPKNEKIFQFTLNVKEEVIGTYLHPVVRRMRYFCYYHGREFQYALKKFYDWKHPDFNVIVYVTSRFIQQRLREIKGIRSKSRAFNMYCYFIQNFNLLFCRDLFAIMRYKEDFFKFERLENFLSFIYDPSLQTLKDVTLKAFFH